MEKVLEDQLNRVYWNAVRKTTVRPPGRLSPEIVFEVDNLIQRGAYGEARDLVQSQPSFEHDPTALQALALALLGLEEPEEAREVLFEAIQRLHERLSVAYGNLSVAHFETGAVDRALAAAYQARQYKKDWCAPWVNLLMCRSAMQDRDGIMADVEAMDKEWPGWRDDEMMRERIQTDATLRFLRESEDVRRLFPAWLSPGSDKRRR